MKKNLLNKEDFLNNKSYSESTELIIDSIIYSPDFNRLAIFLITKNSTSKQLMPNKEYEWYYEATCYLGQRENDTIRLNWIGPSFTNSYDKQEVSSLIRESCLTNFATKDTIGAFTYKYNMNDIRFWNSSIWQEMEEKRERRKEFEEEKKRNSQNIYEPKKL